MKLSQRPGRQELIDRNILFQVSYVHFAGAKLLYELLCQSLLSGLQYLLFFMLNLNTIYLFLGQFLQIVYFRLSYFFFCLPVFLYVCLFVCFYYICLYPFLFLWIASLLWNFLLPFTLHDQVLLYSDFIDYQLVN